MQREAASCAGATPTFGPRVISTRAENAIAAHALLDTLAAAMPEGPYLFPEDDLSDLPQRMLAAEIVREQVLRQTHEEVPHHATVETEQWQERKDGSARIDVTSAMVPEIAIARVAGGKPRARRSRSSASTIASHCPEAKLAANAPSTLARTTTPVSADRAAALPHHLRQFSDVRSPGRWSSRSPSTINTAS